MLWLGLGLGIWLGLVNAGLNTVNCKISKPLHKGSVIQESYLILRWQCEGRKRHNFQPKTGKGI